MGNSVDIIIRAVEKGVQATFSKLGASLKALPGQIKTGKVAMDAFNATMGKTNQVAGTMRNSIGGLLTVLGGGAAFGAATKSAFAFNQTIEQSQIGIAALVRTFSEADMSESFSMATDIQKRLQLAGLKTTATYQELLRALQEGVGPALRENFDPKQIVSFTTSMTQAAAAISLPMDQLGQELRAILDGTIDRNARIAKALSIDNEDIVKWKAAGTLFEELDKKLKAFNEAGEQMAATFSGRWSNVKDAIQMALGQGTEKTFAATTAALKRLQDAIVTIDEEAGTFTFSPKLVAALDVIDKKVSAFINSITGDQMANALVSVVNVAAAVVDVFGQFSGAIVAVLNALGPFGPMLVKLIAYLTIFSAGWKALSFAISAPIAVIRALGAAFTVITGGTFLAWLATARAAMSNTAIAAGGLKGAIGALAGVFLAWEVGWNVGEWLNQFDIVQKAGIAMAGGLTAAWLRAKQAWFWLFGTDADMARVEQEMKNAEDIYADMFASVGQGADKAVKSHQKVGEAAVQAANRSGKAVAQATDEMKKKYEEYAKRVQQLQDEIAGKQQSLNEKLRAMGREGMSDLGAWRDQKTEADEYFKVAQQALEAARAATAAGNEELARQKFEESKAAAERAQTAYDGLSNTVEQNDRVVIGLAEGLKTRMDGVKAAGQLGITAMQELKQATSEAAQKLNESTGGQLGKDLPEVAKVFGELTEKAADLGKKSGDFGKSWSDAWTVMLAKGDASIGELENRLTELTKDRNITIHVREVVEKFTGGLARLASGGFPRLSGKLPGSDGPDGIRALLAPGEFIMRSAAVRKYGAALFHALNSMRFDLGSLIGGRISGAISKITVPHMEPVRMFSGGMAGAAVAGASNTYHDSVTVNYYGSGGEKSVREIAREVMREVQKIHRGRS